MPSGNVLLVEACPILIYKVESHCDFNCWSAAYEQTDKCSFLFHVPFNIFMVFFFLNIFLNFWLSFLDHAYSIQLFALSLLLLCCY